MQIRWEVGLREQLMLSLYTSLTAKSKNAALLRIDTWTVVSRLPAFASSSIRALFSTGNHVEAGF